ncbi:MAG TPA: ankyrin repeat domain-containing protein [Rickettsia endosymbiont of Omalisus fontisbellaquei]|nr:ankyrin repeat domain-containing protein [Rickettsia endosymbiont of Omalisus fontisbellaquei]
MYNGKNELWKQLSHAHLTSYPQITRTAAAKLIAQMSSEELSMADKYTRTPLHWIVSRGWKDETQILLSKLSIETINRVSELDGSVLHEAAYRGYTEVAKILLDASPSLINIRDGNGEIPLHHAAKNNESYKIIEYILQENLNLIETIETRWGRTALHIAAECRCKKIVEILLKYSPNLANKVDNWGWTPLHFAVRNGGDEEIVQMLLSVMSQELVDQRPLAASDVTALSLAISHFVLYTSSNKHERVVEMLLNSTSPKYYFTSIKGNILYRAITSGNERVVAMVLNKIIKEDVTISLECINLALDLANNTKYQDIRKNKNIVKLIEDKLGLNKDKENIPELQNENHCKILESSKFKQLISAIDMNNTIDAVKLITQMSSRELNKLDQDGGTALHWATAKGNEQVVISLLKKNPNLINIENKYGLAALSIADIYDFPRIVELLKNFLPSSLCEYEDLLLGINDEFYL